MTERRSLFHGGMAGLSPGDTIKPDQAHRKHVDGCATCEAISRNESNPFDSPTPAGWVYATSDQPYARHYASKARGDLYRVTLVGDVERSTEDHFRTWRGRKARVVSVVERSVTLTMPQRSQLFKRWGGTAEEFRAMVAAVEGRL